MLTPTRALGLTLMFCACADDLDRAPEIPVAPRSGTVELIGVAGRQLGDGDVYRVPLDYDRKTVPPEVTRREAFVIINDSDASVLVSLMIDEGDEWALYAPVRAHDVPLSVQGVMLPPGARLDFDVGFRPVSEGERSTTLELVVERAGVIDTRVIELRARCARGPP